MASGYGAHQRRRARVAFGEKDVTRTQQSRQREHVAGRRGAADRRGKKARDPTDSALEGTTQ